MTSTPPSRVSGLSALTWSRILTAVWIVGAAVLVITVFVYFFAGRHTPSWLFWLVLPFLALGAAANIIRVRRLPNEKREVQAGYTTLRRSNPEVPQLDPGTGMIVRAAGQPYLARRVRREPSVSELGARPPSLLRRLGPTLLWLLAGLVFIAVVYSGVGEYSGRRLGILLLFELAFFGFFALVLALASFGGRRTIRRLREAAPGQLVFWFATFPEFSTAVARINPAPGTRASDAAMSRRASASTDGLTFWRGNPLWEAGTLPWSRVLSVQYDRVRRGRSTYPRVVVTFRPEGSDDVLALGLVRAQSNGLPLPSGPETRWIADQLEQLRTSTTSARVL